MKNIIKTVGFLTILALIPGAFAATSRIGVNTKAASRIPSIAGRLVATTSNTSSGSTSLLASAECIENYTSCIQGDDVCGADMAECTSKTLFHAKMPKCSSVLIQCSKNGIDALFGTSDFSALSNSTGSGEDKVYTYPTDGSVMGQMVVGSEISNRLSTEQCVRRYTNCLHRDDVCGSDFELCTEKTKLFKKQAVLCASTLERCQNEGKTELFGSATAAKDLKPSDDSRLGVMIKEGAELAALNAVKTCQKVVDNCLVKACSANPWRCIEGIKMGTIDAADIVAGGTTDSVTKNSKLSENGDTISSDYDLYKTTGSDVRKFFKSACLDTIGSNRYCHMTFREKVPSDRELGDIDLQEDVFSLAYSARKEYANVKIQEMLKKFDTDAKDACYDTIKSCTMRSCGGGIGSVCYKSSQYADGIHVNGSFTYNDIKSGCAAIVNTDSNCKYAASAVEDDTYTYNYMDEGAFATLFPLSSTGKDPIGAVAKLNALLATSYNDAAIESLKKQCQSVALACVQSMCGTDYVNCYRNRTDIKGAGTYNTGANKFDNSMNKVGGVLDYNIVIGLCLNTVTTSSVCEEHLKLAAVDWRNSELTDNKSWGGSTSVREAWLGSNTTDTPNKDILVACQANSACDLTSGIAQEVEPVNGSCDSIVQNGCAYNVPRYIEETEFVLQNAGTTLFQQLLANVEREVQAQYNAKLTKEQNTCLAQNSGGIMDAKDNGSTYMWVKLASGGVPNNYATKGLQTKNFTSSNDLYGSFCRARVTVTSDDKTIQDELGNEATAYFAVGDTFTCGSWIDQKTLDKITEKVAEKAKTEAGKGGAKEKAALAWSTVGGFLGGGLGGYFGMDAIQKNGGSLGGLLTDRTSKQDLENTQKNAQKCSEYVSSAQRKRAKYRDSLKSADFDDAVNDALSASRYASRAGINISGLTFNYVGENYAEVEAKDPVYGYKDSALNTFKSAVTRINCTDAKKDGKKAVLDCNQDKNSVTAAWLASQNKIFVANDENTNPMVDLVKGEFAEYDTVDFSGFDRVVADLKVEKLQDGVAHKEAGNINDSTAVTDFDTNIRTLQEKCMQAESAKNNVSDNNRFAANMTAGAVGATVAGVLGLGISKTVLDVKYENAANEAVKAWMEEIGDHIHCYIGGEEAGSYGDVVSISFD